MFARVRTLVILIIIVGGVIRFAQNSGQTTGQTKEGDVPVNSQIETNIFDNAERESDEEVYEEVYGEIYGEINIDDAIKETNEKDLAREVYNKDLIEAGIDDWRLLLVNADNPVPDDYTFELSNIDNIRKFDSRAIDHLEKLIEDCRRETRDVIWAQSTYRDENEQNTVFNNKVQEYMDLGNSREEAEKLAATVTSRPGTSEHHVGLAVDFNYAKTDFENTAAFKWLAENAHKYGFILRYPKGKESITNIVYEPWHFRYVGKEHAEVIKSKGFCLEEYINYLIYQVQN